MVRLKGFQQPTESMTMFYKHVGRSVDSLAQFLSHTANGTRSGALYHGIWSFGSLFRLLWDYVEFYLSDLKNDIAKAIDVLIVMFQTLSAFSTQESELDFLMEAVIMRYE